MEKKIVQQGKMMFSADNFADFKNALMGLSGTKSEEPIPKKEEPIPKKEEPIPKKEEAT